MRNRVSEVAAVFAAAALTLSACSSGEPSGATSTRSQCTPAHSDLKTITQGVLTVAQYEYPPFSSYQGGKLAGVEGDILTKIAQKECLQIKVVQGDAAAMITSVSTGRADTTLGSWYRTKERAKVVRLGAPIVTSPLAAVSTKKVATVDEIKELNVGTVQGFVAAQDLQNLLGNKLKIYPNPDALFADVKAGRVDVAVLGLGAAVTQLRLTPIDNASAQPIAPDKRIASTVAAGQTNFPVNLKNEALGQALDEGIVQIRDSGELGRIATSYGFPSEVANPGSPNLL
jgi:polar amino acid transport system substrate-binding protein